MFFCCNNFLFHERHRSCRGCYNLVHALWCNCYFKHCCKQQNFLLEIYYVYYFPDNSNTLSLYGALYYYIHAEFDSYKYCSWEYHTMPPNTSISIACTHTTCYTDAHLINCGPHKIARDCQTINIYVSGHLFRSTHKCRLVTSFLHPLPLLRFRPEYRTGPGWLLRHTACNTPSALRHVQAMRWAVFFVFSQCGKSPGFLLVRAWFWHCGAV